jgi:hypothetical protein
LGNGRGKLHLAIAHYAVQFIAGFQSGWGQCGVHGGYGADKALRDVAWDGREVEELDLLLIWGWIFLANQGRVVRGGQYFFSNG